MTSAAYALIILKNEADMLSMCLPWWYGLDHYQRKSSNSKFKEIMEDALTKDERQGCISFSGSLHSPRVTYDPDVIFSPRHACDTKQW